MLQLLSVMLVFINLSFYISSVKVKIDEGLGVVTSFQTFWYSVFGSRCRLTKRVITEVWWRFLNYREHTLFFSSRDVNKSLEAATMTKVVD